jgi:hypothetical protein
MQYKINSLEVYKSQEPIPQVAADVEAFDADGNSLVHKTVVVSAEALEKADDAVTAMIEADLQMQDEHLKKQIEEQIAREDAWAQAQKVIDALADTPKKYQQGVMVSVGKVIDSKPVGLKG